MHKERKKVERIVESLSLEYRSRLAGAKEETGEIKVATFIRDMNTIEA